MTVDVDNADLIGCYCSVVSVNYSVKQRRGSVWGTLGCGRQRCTQSTELNLIISASTDRQTQSSKATLNCECVIEANNTSDWLIC